MDMAWTLDWRSKIFELSWLAYREAVRERLEVLTEAVSLSERSNMRGIIHAYLMPITKS